MTESEVLKIKKENHIKNVHAYKKYHPKLTLKEWIDSDTAPNAAPKWSGAHQWPLFHFYKYEIKFWEINVVKINMHLEMAIRWSTLYPDWHPALGACCLSRWTKHQSYHHLIECFPSLFAPHTLVILSMWRDIQESKCQWYCLPKHGSSEGKAAKKKLDKHMSLLLVRRKLSPRAVSGTATIL